MKINPIGIQSYQRLERRDGPANRLSVNREVPKADSSVTFSPQEVGKGSRLAVKAPNVSSEEFLTSSERKALQLLLSRFNDVTQSELAHQRATEVGGGRVTVGSIIDVKV